MLSGSLLHASSFFSSKFANILDENERSICFVDNSIAENSTVAADKPNNDAVKYKMEIILSLLLFRLCMGK